jgi:hypothetical protein
MGSKITFQVPVDADPDEPGLQLLDAGGNVVFGATFGTTHQADKDIIYEFIPNRVGGVDETLDEAALGIDLSGDSQTTGSFKRGCFWRTVEGSEYSHKVSDVWFLYGAEDGGTVEDAIFTEATDGTITIRLLSVNIIGRLRAPIRATATATVRPFNP